jgi:hypothetical protein
MNRRHREIQRLLGRESELVAKYIFRCTSPIPTLQWREEVRSLLADAKAHIRNAKNWSDGNTDYHWTDATTEADSLLDDAAAMLEENRQ